jgi:acetylornithine deacetylase
MKPLTDILQDLIRIPSASHHSNRAIIDYATSAFHLAGWTTSTFTYSDAAGVEKLSLIAAPPGQNCEQPLVDLALLCHTDTVPPSKDWVKALEPFIEDGVLYGCGACDVKGFLACLLSAVADKPNLAYSQEVRIVLTADEEIGCLGSHRLLAESRLRPRSLIIGEPTSLHPARAGKGYCVGEIAIFGAEAHSAHPQRGRSAIYDAARVIQAVEQYAEKLAEEVNPLFDPPFTTINIGTVHGGTAKNIVPAECRFLVEWRPIPGQSPEFIPDGIRRILDGLKRTHPALKHEFTIARRQSGFETPPDSRLVQAVARLTGRDPIAIPFGSEASVFANVAEEILVFGPGDMRTAHSPRECVPVAELEVAVACIKMLLQADHRTTS